MVTLALKNQGSVEIFYLKIRPIDKSFPVHSGGSIFERVGATALVSALRLVPIEAGVKKIRPAAG
ncbi:MAG: hypothetical protein AMR96_06485 [Candidatus Adiutrix intracellularis]|nr:MAG: hypothetical protein AMR96_06485 [Candidatus Adiutrix intracellularis]